VISIFALPPGPRLADGLRALWPVLVLFIVFRGAGYVVQNWALRGLGISELDLFAELRRQGVGDPSDIEWAEIRTGGAIDYRLKPASEPATKSNIDDLHRELRELRDAVGRLATG